MLTLSGAKDYASSDILSDFFKCSFPPCLPLPDGLPEFWVTHSPEAALSCLRLSWSPPHAATSLQPRSGPSVPPPVCRNRVCAGGSETASLSICVSRRSVGSLLRQWSPRVPRAFLAYAELQGAKSENETKSSFHELRQARAFKGHASLSSFPGLYFKVGGLGGTKPLAKVGWEDPVPLITGGFFPFFPPIVISIGSRLARKIRTLEKGLELFIHPS